MFKSGQKVLVVAAALAASGKPGFVDGPITITADNGATVEPIDATSAHVTLAAGTTTVTASALAEGNAISGTASADAGDVATEIKLTLSAE